MTRGQARCVLATMLLTCVAPPDARANDITAQISGKGLDFIADEVLAMLPTSFSHVGFTKELVDCPWGDTDLEVSNVKATVQVGSVQITPAAGSLVATLKASGSGSFDAAVTQPYACTGSTLTCMANFAVSKATATFYASPQVAAGKGTLVGIQVSINVSSDDVDIKLSDCGLGSSLGNLVMPLVKGYIVDEVEDYLEDMLSKELPLWLEKSFGSFGQMGGQMDGISVSAQLASFAATSSGVQIGVGLQFQPETQPPCSLSPAPVIPSPAAPPPASFNDEHLALVLPSTTPARAVVAAWQAGRFCISGAELQQLGMPVTAGNVLGALIGMTNVDEMSIEASEAPSLDFVAGAEPQFKVTLREFKIRLDGKNAQGQATTATVVMTVEVDAELTLDPISRAVVLHVKSLAVSGFQLNTTDSGAPKASAKLVQAMIESTAVPLILAKVDALELMPTVVAKTGGAFDPYYLTISRVAAAASDVTLWAKVFRQPTADSSAPTTALEKQPSAVVVPQRFRFVATGTDDQTPCDLVRFSWRVDNGAWSAPAFSRGMWLQLETGKHTVAVRAVDLNGNIDGNPASGAFTVDGVAPTLALSQSPPANIRSSTVAIGWTMSDNLSPAPAVEAKAAAAHKDPATGQETSFYDGGFVAGVTSLDLRELTNGEYTVTVVARDGAGNLSKPVKVSFTVTDQKDGVPGPQAGLEGQVGEMCGNGCAMAGPAPGRLAALVLLVLGLPLARRRRGYWAR